MLKLLEVRGEWQRDANRNDRNLQESALSEEFNQLLIELSTLSREELLARFKHPS